MTTPNAIWTRRRWRPDAHDVVPCCIVLAFAAAVAGVVWRFAW